jgi:hypothetical protein
MVEPNRTQWHPAQFRLGFRDPRFKSPGKIFPWVAEAQTPKVFCFFFSKKKFFLTKPAEPAVPA